MILQGNIEIVNPVDCATTVFIRAEVGLRYPDNELLWILVDANRMSDWTKPQSLFLSTADAHPLLVPRQEGARDPDE